MSKLTLTLLAALVAGSAACAGELILGSYGKSNYQIVIPDKYPTDRLKESVDEAAKLLQKAFAENGIDLQIAAESAMEKSKPAIYIGRTTFAEKNGIDFANMPGWTYAFKVVGKNLIVAGNDQPDPIPLEKRRQREARRGGIPYLGTLKGVTEFLYRHVGTRFLTPGDHGVEFLPTPTVAVPSDLDVVRRPHMRDIEVSRSNDIYSIANGFEPSPTTISNWGHYHHTAVNAAAHGEDHPEYFVFHSRKRDNRSQHLCVSNPEVQELIYMKVLEDCDTGYDVIEMGQEDGFRPCSCENCRELYGIHPSAVPEDGAEYLRDEAWGRKLWIMHRQMAERLKEDRPGKKLMISAYSVARQPPSDIDSLPDNAIVEMMHPTQDIFARWRRIDVPGGFAAYTYTWGSRAMTPKNSIRHIKELADTLLENQVQAMQINLKPRFYGLEGGNVYVFRRLLNDPKHKSADELFDEYLEASYREGSGLMRQFFRRFNQRVDFMREAADYAIQNRNPMLRFNTIYTPELMNMLDSLLTRAEKVVTSPGARHRLAATRIEFDYLKHIVDTMRHYQSYLTQPDQASLERVLDSVDARNAWLEQLAAQRDRPTYRWVKLGRLKGSLGEPFDWNTAEVRASETPWIKKPPPSVTVMKTDQPVSLNAPAWENVPAHELRANAGESGELKEKTTFQLLYDEQNLYVRFRAGMRSELMNSFNPRGRDAELWLQESVNILLAPEGDRSQYYYLTYEPVPNSFIDANHGYITDPLHPKFGWNDQTWDGEWKYENELAPDRDEWLSMATIPFSTLNAPTPKPGTVWAANFGRVHYQEILTSTQHRDRVKVREISVWHDRLIGSRNPGDAFMGDIEFE